MVTVVATTQYPDCEKTTTLRELVVDVTPNVNGGLSQESPPLTQLCYKYGILKIDNGTVFQTYCGNFKIEESPSTPF